MLRRTLICTPGLLVLLALAGCSFRQDTTSLSVQIDKQQLRAYLQAMNRTGFDCYFVSVDGPGIEGDTAAINLGGRNPSCLGLGVNSSLLSFDDITTTRTRLRVYGGSDRRVRIMGVNTSAPTCAGQPLSGVFGTRRPSIYEVASATVDLYSDKAVDVTGSLSNAGADIVPACDNSIAGEDTQLVATGGVLATTLSLSGGQVVRAFQIGSDLIPVLPVDSASLGNLYNTKVRVTPNGANLFVVGTLNARSYSTLVQRFIPDVEGVFATGAKYRQTFPDIGTNLLFSGDSKAAYIHEGTFLYQNSIGAEKLDAIGASYCEVNYLSSVTFANSFVYFPQASDVKYLSYPSNGDVCATSTFPQTTPTSGVNIAGKVHRNGIYYQLAFNAPSYYLIAYQPSATGAWTTSHGLPVLLSATPSALYLDREGKFIFIVSDTGLNLTVVPLNPSGTLMNPVDPVNLALTVTDLAVEPRSKAVYVSSGVEVHGYSISDGGVLTGLPFSLSPTGGATFDSIATVPLF